MKKRLRDRERRKAASAPVSPEVRSERLARALDQFKTSTDPLAIKTGCVGQTGIVFVPPPLTPPPPVLEEDETGAIPCEECPDDAVLVHTDEVPCVGPVNTVANIVEVGTGIEPEWEPRVALSDVALAPPTVTQTTEPEPSGFDENVLALWVERWADDTPPTLFNHGPDSVLQRSDIIEVIDVLKDEEATLPVFKSELVNRLAAQIGVAPVLRAFYSNDPADGYYAGTDRHQKIVALLRALDAELAVPPAPTAVEVVPSAPEPEPVVSLAVQEEPPAPPVSVTQQESQETSFEGVPDDVAERLRVLRSDIPRVPSRTLRRQMEIDWVEILADARAWDNLVSRKAAQNKLRDLEANTAEILSL